jgi:dTDP-4-dehydrorhamnose reductase
MEKDVLVFSGGWIGERIAESILCNSFNGDLKTYSDIQKQIDIYKPKVIINCLDFPRKSIDDCEKDIDKTLFTLSEIPLLMGEAAIRNNLKLVHLSSSAIFEYNDPKREQLITEDVNPDYFDTLFARVKIYSESSLMLLGTAINVLILRIGCPLDYIPNQGNLLSKLLSFSSVIDIPLSITYIPDLIEAIKYLVGKDAQGLYNVVNYGGLKHKELLEEYRKWKKEHIYAIMDIVELKKVRTFPRMSTDKLEEEGFPVRDIHDVIGECVEKYVSIVKENKQQLL